MVYLYNRLYGFSIKHNISKLCINIYMNKYNYTSSSDITYIDDLYSKYKSDPLSVDLSWQKFFEGFDFSTNSSFDFSNFTEFSVSKLIESYRRYGHLNSLTNPIRTRRNHNVSFNINHFGLSDLNLSQTFSSGNETVTSAA